MKTNLLFLFLLGSSLLFAQTTSDFESFSLPIDSYLDGSDLQGGFSNGNVYLYNDYNVSFSSWIGWSISSETDNLTSGFGNQYASIVGGGYNNSSNYAVAYVSGASKIRLDNQASGGALESIYVTNNTYAYYSMKDGDAFAKKFGGVTGNDPDYFLLTIRKYLNGQIQNEQVEVFLADFRFSDNSQDYILDDWTFVDLSPLGNADSLDFTLSSSDNGSFGMNTPAYFCIDNLITKDALVSSVANVNQNIKLSLYPNPSQHYIHIDTEFEDSYELEIYDAFGNLVLHSKTQFQHLNLDVSQLSKGKYQLVVLGSKASSRQSFIIM